MLMKFNMLKMLIIAMMAGGMSLLVGCDKKSDSAPSNKPGVGERAGAAVDKAADKTVEAAKTAATATKDATVKAVEKTGEAMEKAGAAVEKTGEDMQK